MLPLALVLESRVIITALKILLMLMCADTELGYKGSQHRCQFRTFGPQLSTSFDKADELDCIF